MDNYYRIAKTSHLLTERSSGISWLRFGFSLSGSGRFSLNLPIGVVVWFGLPDFLELLLLLFDMDEDDKSGVVLLGVCCLLLLLLLWLLLGACCWDVSISVSGGWILAQPDAVPSGAQPLAGSVPLAFKGAPLSVTIVLILCAFVVTEIFYCECDTVKNRPTIVTWWFIRLDERLSLITETYRLSIIRYSYFHMTTRVD